jgi:hypothetical protein
MTERRAYAIESDDPHCILGYYGPFETLDEAIRHFKGVSTLDTTASLVYKTRAELNARSDVLMTTRSHVKHALPTFPAASPFDAAAGYDRSPAHREPPMIRVRDDTGKSTRKVTYGPTIEEQQ